MIGADGKAVTETVEVLRPAFKVVSGFDVAQTDGKELPDIIVDELKGTVENYEAFLDALRQESPVLKQLSSNHYGWDAIILSGETGPPERSSRGCTVPA